MHLILVPGLMCDQTAWQPVLPGLSSFASCHVVDHGEADSLVQMAQQLLADAPKQFAIAGHSMGGRVALEVLRLAPERVTHVGLFDTGHLPKPAGAAGDEEVRKRMALLNVAQTQGVRTMAREWVKGMVAPRRLDDAALIQSILDMFERKSADIFERQLRALIERPDSTSVLQHTTQPTLLLCGEQDAWSPPAQHEAMAHCMPQRPAVVSIPDCGHMAMQEQPEAVLQAMRAWLTQAGGRACSTLLFDGVAYGMLLFILAVGLSVTMGLMNFINLAHGAFAMVGGYITVLLMQRLDVPFLLCLPLAFLGAALLGAVLERTLYRVMYRKPHLDQVLFSIGLAFMSVASVDYFMGSQQQIMQLPEWLRGRTEFGNGDHMWLGMGHYRLFIIAVCAVLTVMLQRVLTRTHFGSRLRASVDDSRVAAGLGIPVNHVFALTFAVGSGLAGLGGALGAEVLGLDPTFPLKFMVYFLIVVAVGGTSSITGPLLAALLLGVADVTGKYYVPKLGAFIVYALMIALLIWRPQGLFVRKGGK